MKVRSLRYLMLVAVVALVLGATGCSSLGFVAGAPASVASDVVQTATGALSTLETNLTVEEDQAANTLPAPTTALTVDQEVEALQNQIIQVYEMAAPAVVNITNRGYVNDMFMGTVPQEGTGSGFVYDNEGHILTNYHVIENAEQLLVTLSDGQTYEAKVVGSDSTNDLAVIQIDATKDLPEPLVLGDADSLQVGQFVLAIGNPFGLEQTLTTGVVSALGRVIQSPEDNRFIGEAIQTDAAINPGNSGGPLLDLSGQVIGVNSQIISASGTSSGVGFAVSASTVERVVPQLIANGKYVHPMLGIQLLSLTPGNKAALEEAGAGVAVDSGVLVMEVEAGGPAAKAGILGGSSTVRIGNYQVAVGGDIIVAINDQKVTDSQDLTVYLETETTVGDTVELTIVRNGEQQVVPVVLGERQ